MEVDPLDKYRVSSNGDSQSGDAPQIFRASSSLTTQRHVIKPLIANITHIFDSHKEMLLFKLKSLDTTDEHEMAILAEEIEDLTMDMQMVLSKATMGYNETIDTVIRKFRVFRKNRNTEAIRRHQGHTQQRETNTTLNAMRPKLLSLNYDDNGIPIPNRDFRILNKEYMTASNTSQLGNHLAKKLSAKSKVLERVGHELNPRLTAMEYGTQNEHKGVEAYIQKTGHKVFYSKKKNIYTSEDKLWRGEPDGLISIDNDDGTKSIGILEVKCPHTLSLDPNLGAYPYIEHKGDGVYEMVPNTDIYCQMHIYMYLTGTTWAKLLVWNQFTSIICHLDMNPRYLDVVNKTAKEYIERHTKY